MSINKRILLCLLLLLLVGGVSFHLIHQSPKYIAQKKEIEKQESQLVHDKDTKLPYTFLNNVIAQSGATRSVYYKSLDTGEVFYNFSGKMPAGGLIRPYVAAALLDAVKEGNLSLDETVTVSAKALREKSPALSKIKPGSKVSVRILLEDMMLDQDETALYELVRLIGWDEINAYLLKKGYADTILGSPDLVKTEETAEDKEKSETISYTSVNDMVTLLTRLYEGTCVSKELDAYLLGLMEKQNDRQLLGALLPKKLRLAQVSTSEGRVQNAGGIIYAKEKYILVIMTDKALRKDETMKTINQISSIIFNTVNDKEVFKK